MSSEAIILGYNPITNLPEYFQITDDGRLFRSVAGLASAYQADLGAVAAKEYVLAVRGSQAGYGNVLDMSGQLNDAAAQAALFPVAWAASTVYSLGQYRSPTTPNGILYKCTTAGTSGSSEPSWTTTLGNTTNDGTAVWTAEKGPWYLSTGGYKQLRSIVNTQLSAGGAFTFAKADWNLAAGDSLIVSVQQQFNFTSGGATNFSETQVMANRVAGSGAGFGLIATGQTTFNDLRLRISDGTTTRTSAHLASGFGRKPGDGSLRTTTFMVDGQTKRMYCFADAVAMNVGDYTGVSTTDIVAWDGNISAVTGSTVPVAAGKLTLGGAPGSSAPPTTTYEFGIKALDVLILPARRLPVNLQDIATWFHQRGESPLPQSLVA